MLSVVEFNCVWHMLGTANSLVILIMAASEIFYLHLCGLQTEMSFLAPEEQTQAYNGQ